MLFQQLKSMHSLHLEDVGESVNNPSITVANYNQEQRHSPILHDSQGTCILIDNGCSSDSQQRHSPILYTDSHGTCTLFNKSLNWIRYFLGKISQSTRSGFGESSSNTLLGKLWYTYSYIYRIIILILLAILLMPTTDSATKSIGIVSPSPHITRTRSFTMPDFTPIIKYSFRFAEHHQSPALDSSLNNTYSEPVDDTVTVHFFTDNLRTVVDPDAISKIRIAIVDLIENCSTAD